MRVLMTGGTGFIASHVAKALIEEGHEVYNVTTPFQAQEYFYQKMLSDAGVTPIPADLRDKYALDLAVREANPDVVMHYAALTSVAQSFRNPVVFAEVNYIGTINLIKACMQHAHNLERFYYIATTESLKSREKPHSEFDLEYDANSPYGVSKMAAEFYAKYAYKVGFPATIIRYNNTFHRKTSRHYLIETVITQLLEGPKVVLKGSSKIKRTWTLIDDVVDGTLHCMKYSKPGELYHIVNPNNQATIADVIRTAAKVMGYDNVEIVEGTEPRPHDPVSLCLTSERLDEIHWKPKYDLADALKVVIDYWR